jgi:hypothetical protein
MARKHSGSRRRHTRKGGKRGIFRILYTPIGETIGAANNVTRATTRTAEGIVHTTLRGLNTIGRRVTDRADAVIRKVFTRRQRKH